MSWTFDNKKPIYLQIMEKIKLQMFPIRWNPINNFQPCESWLARLVSIPTPSKEPCQTSNEKALSTASEQLDDL